MVKTSDRHSKSDKGHSWSPEWWVGIAALVVATPASAQHTLRGRAVDTTGTGIPGVEIVLAEAGRRSVTDSGGRYTVTGIPMGRYEVVLRRLGYAPVVVFRSFMGDTGTTALTVELRREAVVLPEVETKAKGPEAVPVKLRGWAQRRELNVGGKFWDDSLLRTKEYQRLPEVLQGVSGVRIVRAMGKRFLATGGGRAGNSPRGGTGGRPIDPRIPRACYAEVYVDGIKLGFAYEPPNLDDYPVHQIQAMEFYRSTSEIPVEFNSMGSACGVLAIWTRVGGNKK